MKTCRKNSRCIRVIVRFGVLILVAMVGLGLAAESVTNSRDYTHVSKPRSKPREIRGFKPQYLSSAIGFGKRTSDFESSNTYGRQSTILLPVKDESQRFVTEIHQCITELGKYLKYLKFPNEWFIKFLLKNPDLASKVERKLLHGDETLRPSGTRRFREDSDEVTYYFKE